jgi:hypothetical protein
MRAGRVALDFHQRAQSPFEAGSALRNSASWWVALDTLALVNAKTADVVALECAFRFCAERRIVTAPFSRVGLGMFRGLEARGALDATMGIHAVRLNRVSADWETALAALAAITSAVGAVGNDAVYEYITAFPTQWRSAAAVFSRSHRDGVFHGLLAIGARRLPTA